MGEILRWLRDESRVRASGWGSSQPHAGARCAAADGGSGGLSIPAPTPRDEAWAAMSSPAACCGAQSPPPGRSHRAVCTSTAGNSDSKHPTQRQKGKLKSTKINHTQKSSPIWPSTGGPCHSERRPHPLRARHSGRCPGVCRTRGLRYLSSSRRAEMVLSVGPFSFFASACAIW